MIILGNKYRTGEDVQADQSIAQDYYLHAVSVCDQDVIKVLQDMFKKDMADHPMETVTFLEQMIVNDKYGKTAQEVIELIYKALKNTNDGIVSTLIHFLRQHLYKRKAKSMG